MTAVMTWIQQMLSRYTIWTQALILTLGVSLLVLAFGLLMGAVRHGIIEGVLVRLLGPKIAMFLGYYLTFPGTLHHELSHALGYLITGGQVHEISIIPKADPDGSVRLGYVSGSTQGPMLARAIQSTFSSVAPLFFGFLSLWLLFRFALPHASGAGMRALLCYLMVSIALHMELSRQDLRVLATGLLPTLLLVYLAIAAGLALARLRA